MPHLFVALNDNAPASDWAELRETLKLVGFGSSPVGTVPTPVVTQPQKVDPQPIPTQVQPQAVTNALPTSNGDPNAWFPGMVINDNPDSMAKGRLAAQAYRAFKKAYGRTPEPQEKNAIKAGQLVVGAPGVTPVAAVAPAQTMATPQVPMSTQAPSAPAPSDRMAQLMANVQRNLGTQPVPQTPQPQPAQTTQKSQKRTVRFVSELTEDEFLATQDWMNTLVLPAKKEALGLWLAGHCELRELTNVPHKTGNLGQKLANRLSVNIG